MLGWFYRIFVGRFSGCNHKWEAKERIATYGPGNEETPAYHKYVLQCEHCGDMKIIDSRK